MTEDEIALDLLQQAERQAHSTYVILRGCSAPDDRVLLEMHRRWMEMKRAIKSRRGKKSAAQKP